MRLAKARTVVQIRPTRKESSATKDDPWQTPPIQQLRESKRNVGRNTTRCRKRKSAAKKRESWRRAVGKAAAAAHGGAEEGDGPGCFMRLARAASDIMCELHRTFASRQQQKGTHERPPNGCRRRLRCRLHVSAARDKGHSRNPLDGTRHRNELAARPGVATS